MFRGPCLASPPCPVAAKPRSQVCMKRASKCLGQTLESPDTSERAEDDVVLWSERELKRGSQSQRRQSQRSHSQGSQNLRSQSQRD